MSDPLAVSILSKLSGWYDFEGDLSDSHGSFGLTGAVVAGYEQGKIGQSLKRASRASAEVTHTTVSAHSGQLTIGGWFKYTSAAANIASAGYGLTTTPDTAQNEILYIGNKQSNGNFAVTMFGSDGENVVIEDTNGASIAYPITVLAVDADGVMAESKQTINISSGTNVLVPGWYFGAATMLDGVVRLYLNGDFRATGTAPKALKSPVTTLQLAEMYGSTVSDPGYDSCFFSLTAAMTPDEIAWLFNSGTGRSYADLKALAA